MDINDLITTMSDLELVTMWHEAREAGDAELAQKLKAEIDRRETEEKEPEEEQPELVTVFKDDLWPEERDHESKATGTTGDV